MIIGIHGKIGAGKDLSAELIQYVTSEAYTKGRSFEQFKERTTNPDAFGLHYKSNWSVEKYAYAYALKQICSILTGIPVEDFQKEEVKNQTLPEEWNRYIIHYSNGTKSKPYFDYNAAERYVKSNRYRKSGKITTEPITVRWLLQNVGTNALREIIHPNIWVNTLYAKYVFDENGNLPNWLITDTRFKNEAEGIKKRNGIIISIQRNYRTSEQWQKKYPKIMVLDPDGWHRDSRYQFEWFEEKITLEEYQRRVGNSTCICTCDVTKAFEEHISETDLDNYKFDYVVENTGTINELLEKLIAILKKENLLYEKF